MIDYLKREHYALLLIGALLISGLLLWASYFLLFPQVVPQTADHSTPSAPIETTSTSPLAVATSTATSTIKTVRFLPPYPLTWQDGGVTFTLTSASLDDTKLSLGLRITMPNSALCVPLHIERLVDEAGNFAKPDTGQFILPSTGGCIGVANTTYDDQYVVFSVRPENSPFVFTTGGTSNVFFTASVSDAGQLNVIPAATSG